MFHQLNNSFFITHSNLNLCQVDSIILTYQPIDAIAYKFKNGKKFLRQKKVKDVKTTIIYTQTPNS
ncbi:MAG: hypothetical protein KME40_13805 [Komarekiella atlantica HA4396-MV6]|nr:hypothetical protein [Komarekiella atlantica HA4396-MV6]